MPIKSLTWCLAGVLSAVASFAHAAPVWSNTATQAIPLVDAVRIGAVNPSSQVRVSLALKMQNGDALRNLVKSQNTKGSPAYRKFLTPAQFNAGYAPSSNAVAQVRAYLVNAGFSNITATPNHLFVTATASAAKVESAFNTSLTQFVQNGRIVFVNTKAAQVPKALNGIVLSVLGLNNVQMHTQMKMRQSLTPCDVTSPTCVRFTYDPQTFQRAYDVGQVPAATATSIAVMAEGDVSSVIGDLRTFETAMNLRQVPVTVVPVGLPSTDTAGNDEWDLDTQYTTGMAGLVKRLYIYAATSLTDQDTSLEFNKWATDDLAQVANASFSICESFPYLDGSMVADDQIFLEAAAQGQTMFSSTGDTGSFCSVGTPNGVPAGVPLVGYPAASPYVIGVGGTTLMTGPQGGYRNEIAWYAGGGGVSQFEYSPYWQSNVVPTSISGLPVSFRALPDVSMDADANTGAIVYVAGKSQVIGGTSLSSPLAAGSWARLLSKSGNTLGFAAPQLYAGYPAATSSPSVGTKLTRAQDGFHDILTGTNGAYTALPNYDLTTGLGSLDIAAKAALLIPASP